MRDSELFNPRIVPKINKMIKSLIERRGDDFIIDLTEYIIDEKIYIKHVTLGKFITALNSLNEIN